VSHIPAPERLEARTRAVLGGRGTTAEGCLEAAIGITRELLAKGDASRAIALDLLVADALVTRAMELSIMQEHDVDAACVDSMRRLAAIAGDT
jgi:hypothetical protein